MSYTITPKSSTTWSITTELELDYLLLETGDNLLSETGALIYLRSVLPSWTRTAKPV